jgi:lipoprotein-anchoring transpeptidase ErfK/SrfK
VKHRLIVALVVLLLATGAGASYQARGAARPPALGARLAPARATRTTSPTSTARTTPHTPVVRATATPTRTPAARPTSRHRTTRRAAARATPTLTPSSGPVELGNAQFSLYTINPQFTRQDVSVSLSAPARVRVRIAQPGDVSHVRTMDLGVRPAGTITLQWDGRDNAHRLVPAGSYTYTITATNAKGQQHSDTYNMLAIIYKRIVISLSKQQLWAFDGSHYVMSSLVTTGNPALPTPTGHFPILGKYSPFTFVSPWPLGSQYYYAPSPTTYALLFDNRGYYVHDAPWRGNFGPGSNAAMGTPGQNYTGSHGCVNVPFTMMQPLYQWATIGTVVDVTS